MRVPDREARRYSGSPDKHKSSNDIRTVAQSDRDKLVYSSHLRRLAGVTQVVGPNEGGLFHNRLTHTLKVAQLAQRLAQRLQVEYAETLETIGVELDPDAVEAAALAHDLGHPPFGHVAEAHLSKLVDEKMLEAGAAAPPKELPGTFEGAPDGSEDGPPTADGFEGNAQSFRIVTRLAAHKATRQGLDLSRDTLNAILKYPWRRHGKRDSDDLITSPTIFAGVNPFEKYGAYDSDVRDFRWARTGIAGTHRSLGAQIMDYADLLAYSVHDLADFVRAGMIPIGRLLSGKPARRFLGVSQKSASSEDEEARDTPDVSTKESGDPGGDMGPEFGSFFTWFRGWVKKDGFTDEDLIAAQGSLLGFLDMLYGGERYQGTFEQHADLRRMNSVLIGRYLLGVELVVDGSGAPYLHVSKTLRIQQHFLHGLVRKYVIEDPRLATQQRGQREVIGTLFRIYHEAICSGREELLLPRFSREYAEAWACEDHQERQLRCIRLAADMVSSLTDYQAVFMCKRLTGHSLGSVTDVIPA